MSQKINDRIPICTTTFPQTLPHCCKKSRSDEEHLSRHSEATTEGADRYRSRKAGEIVQPARKSRRAVDNQAVCGLKRPPLATVSIGHTPVRFKSPVTVVDHDFRAIFPLEIHPAAMAKIEAVSLTGPDKAERLTRRGSIA